MHKEDTLISVIVPIYNVEVYLPRCLDSVVNQTHRNLEIILVDDGSLDDCGSICERYAEADSRIRVIHQRNNGVASARNTGLRAATGQYIAFVDPDDRIPDDSFRILLNRIRQDGSDLAIGQFVRILGGRESLLSEYSWMQDETLDIHQLLTAIGEDKPIFTGLCGKLFRREILANIEIPNLRCGEDTWIFPAYISGCARISIVARIVYEYHIRENSITRTRDDGILADALKAELHVADFLLTQGYVESGARWFAYALGPALRMKDKKIALRIIGAEFDREERELFWRYSNFRTKVKWAAIYVPLVYKVYSSVKWWNQDSQNQ